MLRGEGTYKITTPKIVVVVLSLHLAAFPYFQLSHPPLLSLRVCLLLLLLLLSLFLLSVSEFLSLPSALPCATYDARHTHAANHNTAYSISTLAKA